MKFNWPEYSVLSSIYCSSIAHTSKTDTGKKRTFIVTILYFCRTSRVILFVICLILFLKSEWPLQGFSEARSGMLWCWQVSIGTSYIFYKFQCWNYTIDSGLASRKIQNYSSTNNCYFTIHSVVLNHCATSLNIHFFYFSCFLRSLSFFLFVTKKFIKHQRRWFGPVN